MDDVSYKIKAIEGFNGRYMVDTDGNVWSMYSFANRWKVRVNKPKKLSPFIGGRKYKMVSLFDDKKRMKKYLVHRLVATAFLDNPENKRCVCHKDNNPLNCAVSNLYWGTDSENITQSYDDRLHKNVKPIAKLDKNGKILEVYKSQTEASKLNNFPQPCLTAYLNGCNQKSVGGFMWKRISWEDYDRYKNKVGRCAN